MISIDGSVGEAGGQVVRTALAFSTLTGMPVEVYNIRKARPTPGLKNQHLHCIRILEQLCNAKSEGAELGSEKIVYHPNKIKGKTISIDIQTAGSITLLLQSVLLPAMFADKKVRIRIKGGTDVAWSMPIDFLKNVTLPYFKRFADIELKLEKRGYYPKGGGRIELKINPKLKISDYNDFNCFLEEMRKAKELNLIERKELLSIKGVSHASEDLMKANVAERITKGAKLQLNKLKCPINIATEYQKTDSTGTGITLWAVFGEDNPDFIGADCLGKPGKRAEQVGQETAKKLLAEIDSEAVIDFHNADNLIPLFAIFNGKFKTSKITNHTKTNISVVERFLGKRFNIDDKVIETI